MKKQTRQPLREVTSIVIITKGRCGRGAGRVTKTVLAYLICNHEIHDIPFARRPKVGTRTRCPECEEK